MALKAAQCPNCGGELQLPENKNEVTCMYCDSLIVVSEAIKEKKRHISEDADKLNNLIKSSIETGDLDQAFKNINQLLELDPDNCHAWILKGKVAFLKISKEMKIPPSDPRGLDDSVLSIDLHAALNEGFNKAINLAGDDTGLMEKVGMELHNSIKDCSKAIIDAENKKFFYGIKMYETSARNRKKHWLKLIMQAIEIEKKASEYYDSFDLAQNVDYIFSRGKGNIFTGMNNFNLPSNLNDWNNSLQAKYIKEYQERAAKNKSKGWCFIATATMGSYDHPKVMELRCFRDNWILTKSWGESFVNWYYNYGAKAAKIIDKSAGLKKLSYLFIVLPLVYLSRMIKIPKQ